jgi:hypothetical protein
MAATGRTGSWQILDRLRPVYSLPQTTRFQPVPVLREALDKIIDAAKKAPMAAMGEE